MCELSDIVRPILRVTAIQSSCPSPYTSTVQTSAPFAFVSRQSSELCLKESVGRTHDAALISFARLRRQLLGAIFALLLHELMTSQSYLMMAF